ncbi:MAG: S1 family peptidase [Bifidobacteriaceae bacterium]|nr:S1 family peptidase [Bifidobacteriaceae bacterium]
MSHSLNGVYQGTCSTGVALNLKGATRLLTAGHCLGSTFINNGNMVGQTYTTAYPTNADIYGDWKAIQGSTYSNYVWNGTVSGTSTLPINSANWGLRMVGDPVCASGQTTGQTCRYFVLSPQVGITFAGVATWPLVQMRHDSNNGTGFDKNGWGSGDSGGPCYYADGNGGVTALGIVTGRSFPSTSYTLYYCTLLKGVRAWDPSATLA